MNGNDKLKCPQCNWSSRVVFLIRTQMYKCEHCGCHFDKEGKIINECGN
jgi:transposase-like protein